MSSVPTDRIGRYKIISQIGEGGMGRVFLAEDPDLGRKVALKILPEDIAQDEERLSRFRLEARAASALNHPNIITVHEIGNSDGIRYIATEFVDGVTLREHIGEQLRDFSEILQVAIQVAEALSAAHRAGITHRDIKPENIMVRPDGYLKVLDFGLAKLSGLPIHEDASEADTKALVKTTPGMVIGTVAYMSPEQARGKEVGPRSDIFSLGVTLYELISGKPPFSGETVTDTLAAIVNSPPTPLGSFVSGVPDELSALVERMLEKDPGKRHSSAEELLEELGDLRQLLRRRSDDSDTEVLPRTKSGISGVVSHSSGAVKDAILLAEIENNTAETIFDRTLKTALSFSLSQSPAFEILPESKVRSILEWMGREAGERVTRELAVGLCQRRGIKAFITGEINSIGSSYVISLEAVSAKSGETLGNELAQVGSKEEVVAAIGEAAAGLREKLGESIGSIQRFNTPIEFATTTSLEALRYLYLGYEQQSIGNNLGAIPFYERARVLDPEFASVYVGLGVSYGNSGQKERAVEMYQKAYELIGSVTENERLMIEFFYRKEVTGEFDKAVEVLHVWGKTYPTHHVPDVNLSSLWSSIGQSEKAYFSAQEAITKDPDNAVARVNLCHSLIQMERPEEAEAECDAAAERGMGGEIFQEILFEAAFLRNDREAMKRIVEWFSGRSDEYMAFSLLAESAAARGRWRKTQEYSKKAIDLAEKSGAVEIAAYIAAHQALRIAFWSGRQGFPEPGDDRLRTVIRTHCNRSLSLERGFRVMALCAVAQAAAGLTGEAYGLIEELRRSRPKDTMINELWIPTANAATALQADKPKEALEHLRATERYEWAGRFVPIYLRGLAFEKSGLSANAAIEFQKMIDHRGISPLSALYPLAHYGKARQSSDPVDYEMFFELWKEADDDMPALVEARRQFEDIDRQE